MIQQKYKKTIITVRVKEKDKIINYKVKQKSKDLEEIKNSFIGVRELKITKKQNGRRKNYKQNKKERR